MPNASQPSSRSQCARYGYLQPTSSMRPGCRASPSRTAVPRAPVDRLVVRGHQVPGKAAVLLVRRLYTRRQRRLEPVSQPGTSSTASRAASRRCRARRSGSPASRVATSAARGAGSCRRSPTTGIRHSLHSLRHSYASLLIANGLNVVFVSRQLGHANPTITLSTYAHLYARADHRTRRARRELRSAHAVRQVTRLAVVTASSGSR